MGEDRDYLIVSNWPGDLQANNTLNYFGVQNGVSFFVMFDKNMSADDIQKILYSLEVSK